ncbi:glycosyltransferase [Microbacterium laevaniformans]|uniref:glycosyltransferase n=1 Tax=Microbacterium laevaniformans TaxID=36807 RepID=UPI00366B9874
MLRLGRAGFIQFGHWIDALAADDLIVDLNPRSATAWALLVLRRLSRKRRTVVWGHLYPQRGGDAATGFLRRIMRRLSSGTVAYTYSDGQRAKIDFPKKPVWVAANSLYRQSDISLPLSTSPRDAFIYVGRFEAAKKVHLAISAFARSGLVEKGARLVLIGGGSEEQRLRDLAVEEGVEGATHFRGWQGEFPQLRREYERAIAALSPGFAGLGLTQSLGFGVPVLVSKVEPHSPEIELTLTGGVEWFTTDDPDSLSSAMRRAWDSRETVPRNRLRDYIHDNYSAEAMASGLQAALRNGQQ